GAPEGAGPAASALGPPALQQLREVRGGGPTGTAGEAFDVPAGGAALPLCDRAVEVLDHAPGVLALHPSGDEGGDHLCGGRLAVGHLASARLGEPCGDVGV